jgi:hypothetical protein
MSSMSHGPRTEIAGQDYVEHVLDDKKVTASASDWMCS